eukprot:13780436-Alexandrium_andersonii.AAC.1
MISRRRVEPDPGVRWQIQKQIWIARQEHREQLLEAQVNEIVQNPQKGRYGKFSDPPGEHIRRAKPYMQDFQGKPRGIGEVKDEFHEYFSHMFGDASLPDVDLPLNPRIWSAPMGELTEQER